MSCHAGSGTVFDTKRVGAQVPLIIFSAAERWGESGIRDNSRIDFAVFDVTFQTDCSCPEWLRCFHLTDCSITRAASSDTGMQMPHALAKICIVLV